MQTLKIIKKDGVPVNFRLNNSEHIYEFDSKVILTWKKHQHAVVKFDAEGSNRQIRIYKKGKYWIGVGYVSDLFALNRVSILNNGNIIVVYYKTDQGTEKEIIFKVKKGEITALPNNNRLIKRSMWFGYKIAS